MPQRDHGRNPFDRDESDSRYIKRVVVSVVATIVAAFGVLAAVHWYQRTVIQTATETLSKASSSILQHAQRTAAEAQARAEQEKAERAATQRQAGDAENARVAAVDAEAARREGAWQKFYVASAPCKNPDNRATMECANEHARAKKEFDKRWAAGEF